MGMLWLPIAIAFIGIPFGLAHYIEKRLNRENNVGKEHIFGELVAMGCVMLWSAFILGMYLG